MKSYHVSVQSRGTIALPADLRRRLHLDEPGAQVQIIEHEDGKIELQPMLPIPADQRWFWTERWQAMEREADEDIDGYPLAQAFPFMLTNDTDDVLFLATGDGFLFALQETDPNPYK